MAESKPVIGYCRVSTEEQAEEGVSLAAQDERIRAWATFHGHRVLDVLADKGISAKSMRNRPKLLAAIELAKQERGILVVYSLCRMSRTTRDCIDTIEDLGAHGVEFVSLTQNIDTTSGMGEFIFTLFAALGQLERKMTAERTRAALRHKKSRGELCGNAPYGMTWAPKPGAPDANGNPTSVKVLVPNPDEQAVIDFIRERLHNDWNMNYAHIARLLKESGHKPRPRNKRGVTEPGEWDRGAVRRLVIQVRRMMQAEGAAA